MHYPATPRAIQYEDVARAADALLYEGQRPTIERIRMRIGRGSPNTVSPMLEQWFSGLGERLHGIAPVAGTAAGSDLPHAVLQAATVLWTGARQQAQEQAENTCAAERTALAHEKSQLQEERRQLEATELRVNERLRAMEETLQLSAQQLKESDERWKLSQRTLAQRDEEIAMQRAAATEFNAQQKALEQQLVQLVAAQNKSQEERASQDECYRQSERRWMEEVDRARQETRKSAQHAQECAKKIENLQATLTLAEKADAAHQAHALEQLRQIETLQAALVTAHQNLQNLQINENHRHTIRVATAAVVRKKSLKKNPPKPVNGLGGV